MRYLILIYFLAIPFWAFSQNEKDAYALGVDGIKLVDQGNYEEGIKLLKQARNLEPSDYDFAFEIGKAYAASGNAKKAEKYLYPLQYHVNVQSDLYILLADCYKELEDIKKNPSQDRKRELDALRYGIQKLPSDGALYLELGKRKLEMEQPIEALAVFENGILSAPNFSENYYWAAKLLKASGNDLWAWIYAELCFNMTEDVELIRSSALVSTEGLKAMVSGKWNADHEKLDQDFYYMMKENCLGSLDGFAALVNPRKCVLSNWNHEGRTVKPLFDRLVLLNERNWLEAYAASMLQETDRTAFLTWLVENGKPFEEYRTWRFWNPLQLSSQVNRLQK